jgi:hypothetical protein
MGRLSSTTITCRVAGVLGITNPVNFLDRDFGGVCLHFDGSGVIRPSDVCWMLLFVTLSMCVTTVGAKSLLRLVRDKLGHEPSAR